MEMSSMRQESEMDMQTIEEPPRSRWRSLAVELKIQKLSKQSTKSYLRFCRRASQQRSAGLPPPGPMRPPVPDLTEVRTSAEIKFLFQETKICIKGPIFPFARCTDHSTPRRGDTSSQETRHPGQLIILNMIFIFPQNNNIRDLQETSVHYETGGNLAASKIARQN